MIGILQDQGDDVVIHLPERTNGQKGKSYQKCSFVIQFQKIPSFSCAAGQIPPMPQRVLYFLLYPRKRNLTNSNGTKSRNPNYINRSVSANICFLPRLFYCHGCFTAVPRSPRRESPEASAPAFSGRTGGISKNSRVYPDSS